MRLPALVTRLVGLWILAGGVLKLLYGSPGDLPVVVRDLPLEIGLTFKLAISVELLVGGLALLRPSAGWLPAKILTVAFLIVLGTQLAGGETSCGCFGSALVITPLWMLLIDGVAFLALIAVKPWRLTAGAGELVWPVTAVLLCASLVLPWVIDRQTTSAEIMENPTSNGLKPWVTLDVRSYPGKLLKDTDLWPVLTKDQRIQDGIIVIWRSSCDVCADHLRELAGGQEGQNAIVLVQLPDEDPEAEPHVHILPEGAWVKRSSLPATAQWDVTPPAHITVVGGRVEAALEGMDVLGIDYRK